MLRALLVVCVLGYCSVVEANDDCPDDGISYQTVSSGTYSVSSTTTISRTKGYRSATCNADDVTITYYFNGVLIKKNVKIKRLDYVKKQISLSDNTLLYYKQIVKIKV